MTDRWRRAPHLASVESEDREVVMPLDDPPNVPIVFEGPALVIWDSIPRDVARTTDEIVADVAQAVQVDPGVVAEDTRNLIAELRDRMLLMNEASAEG